MSGRRKQSYCDSYAETFTFIKKSIKGEHHAYCKSCNCDISISAGGANDIKRHMNNDKHKKNAEALQRASLHTQPLSSFCKKEDLSVIRAEVLFTDFLVEHSIQPAVADHTGELFRQMFPDSRIAKKYACARTKTTQIIKSQKSQVSLIVIQIAEVSMFTVYKFTVTEVEVRSIIGESGANWHPGRNGTPRVSTHVSVANLWWWCFYVARIPTRIPRTYGGQTRLGFKIIMKNHFWITWVYFFNNSSFEFSS